MIFFQSIDTEYRMRDMYVNNSSDIILYHNCDMTTLGERVKAKRKALGLTQKELALKAGVSQTTVSDMERGRNSSSREIALLARALKAETYWLATGKGIDVAEEKGALLEAKQDVKPYEIPISNDGLNIGRSWDLLSDRHRQTILEQIQCYMAASDRNPYSGERGQSHQRYMENFERLGRELKHITFPHTRRKADKQKK